MASEKPWHFHHLLKLKSSDGQQPPWNLKMCSTGPVSSESAWPLQKTQVVLPGVSFQNQGALSWVRFWNPWFSSLFTNCYLQVDLNDFVGKMAHSSPHSQLCAASCQKGLLPELGGSFRVLAHSLLRWYQWFYFSLPRELRHLSPEKRKSRFFFKCLCISELQLLQDW